ncbi:hypothetical protein C4D60_Mb05t05450 [Musa balbisiana]|uniref:Exostosin GT47 domain-containing protein n=1 Tax=Musa balbisiana TaxID=52838 RepID=A0A4S8JTY1_MUSBA|nr:hypothetical protein C4D60_Mb05t05450 [Musa balbisiana]
MTRLSCSRIFLLKLLPELWRKPSSSLLHHLFCWLLLEYVYELPSSYNRDWLSNPRCRSHLFASEVAIHEALLEYPGRVYDPNEADFFFVPVYVSCNFSTLNGFPALHHARPLISSAVRFISAGLPSGIAPAAATTSSSPHTTSAPASTPW